MISTRFFFDSNKTKKNREKRMWGFVSKIGDRVRSSWYINMRPRCSKNR